VNPTATVDILSGIRDYMTTNGIKDISSIKGGLIWEREDL